MLTAIELDLFTKIDEGRHTFQQIAYTMGVPGRGIRMILDSLVGMGLLNKKGTKYFLTPGSKKYLSRQSEFFLGGYFQHLKVLQKRWGYLTKVIKEGKPVAQDIKSRGSFSKLVKSLFALNFDLAKLSAQKLKADKMGEIDILDIGAGSGVWSITVGILNPKARIHVLDFPEMLEIAKGFAKRYGLLNRFYAYPGDLRKIRFERKKYNLIYLGNICHSEGRRGTIKLLQRCRRALKKGGMLVIADFIPNDKRTAPLLPLIFALNMLINTLEGDVFTFGEYKEWLSRVGFSEIRKLKMGTGSPLIIALKR